MDGLMMMDKDTEDGEVRFVSPVVLLITGAESRNKVRAEIIQKARMMMNDDDDRIVQFIPPLPSYLDPDPLPPSPIPLVDDIIFDPDSKANVVIGPIVNQGDGLTCLKCGKVWKSRRGGLKPCPACGDKEWWKEFDLVDLQAIEDRLASQSTDLQPSPSSGRIHCRLVLEVYEPGTSPTVVGIYRKVGAGWPDGDGLGVLRFKVDEQSELEEVMALVKGVVNGR